MARRRSSRVDQPKRLWPRETSGGQADDVVKTWDRFDKISAALAFVPGSFSP
jgi:hypothetical protein